MKPIFQDKKGNITYDLLKGVDYRVVQNEN